MMKWVVAVGVLWVCSGCATIVTGAGPDQKVRISSEPTGAKVTVDGTYRGQTPLSVELTRKDDHQVKMELAGYASHEQMIKSGFNPMVFGNILIGGLIGVGVDLISGASTSLSPGDISPKLVNQPPPAYGSQYPSYGRPPEQYERAYWKGDYK
jgi:PEGA domain